MAKPVWSDAIEEAAWHEKNCRLCYQYDQAWKRITGTGDGCPLLLQAAAGKLPSQWTRRRNAELGETYRCSEHLSRPPVMRRPSVPDETEPMFDIEPADCNLIPVEGWRDYRAEQRGTGGVDHS